MRRWAILTQTVGGVSRWQFTASMHTARSVGSARKSGRKREGGIVDPLGKLEMNNAGCKRRAATRLAT